MWKRRASFVVEPDWDKLGIIRRNPLQGQKFMFLDVLRGTYQDTHGRLHPQNFGLFLEVFPFDQF